MYSLTNFPVAYLANNCLNKYFEISLCGLAVYTELNTEIVILGWFIKEFLLKLQSKNKVYLYPNEVRETLTAIDICLHVQYTSIHRC